MTLETVVAQGAQALALLDDRWDALLRSQDSPSPTQTAGWLRCMARRSEGTPIIVCVERSGELVGAAAAEIVVHRPRLRVARWLGTGPLPLGADFLVAPGVPGVADRIAAALLERAHVASVGPVSPYGPCAAGVRAVAPWAALRGRPGVWMVDLPPPRLDAVRARSASDVRRATRLGADVSVRTHLASEQVADGLERLFALHEQRWRGRTDAIPRFGADADQRAWYRDAVGGIAARGDARLVEVWEGETLVASTLGLLAGHGALFHTTATRPGGALRRPGHAAMLGWVEAALAAGATTLRLGGLSGDPGGPKAALGAVEHARVQLVAAATPRLQSALRAAGWSADRARRLQRSIAGRT